MITGRTVTVVLRVENGRDAFNMPVWDEAAQDVDNVLVAPASTEDLAGLGRPDGDETVIVAHFPKTWSGSLRGAVLVVDGRRFEVVGDPQPYMAANTPGAWNRPVHARLVEG